ncbi:hypothetical protein JTE90_005075 [Oedothorax gibbosus]|uniref:Uncharacterized protein n=1 Tax=Oedothorax gibbosus TaxID=931172 RepID=A0AAV6VAR7_9ARAC|nr:hypothetical protein JTE90_005075 [Oedothorax gibbosus]
MPMRGCIGTQDKKTPKEVGKKITPHYGVFAETFQLSQQLPHNWRGSEVYDTADYLQFVALQSSLSRRCGACHWPRSERGPAPDGSKEPTDEAFLRVAWPIVFKKMVAVTSPLEHLH